MICQFVTEHRARWGVEPICRVLSEHGCTIAPRTYYAYLQRPPSRRALSDARVTARIAVARTPDQRGRLAPESLYGAAKTQAWLGRGRGPDQELVVRCTVERLMRASQWVGVLRKKKFRTTVPDPSHARAEDKVKRNFVVPAPNRLVVADFTDTPLGSGTKAYTSFVIDAFAGTITGRDCSTSKATVFIEWALRQAGQFRRNQGNPLQGHTIHHSDAGSQGGFNWLSQHLDRGGVDGQTSGMDEGVDGPVGDEVAGRPEASAGHPTPVLARDRHGGDQRGRRSRGGCVTGGGLPLVPARWRHASVQLGRARWPVSVVS